MKTVYLDSLFLLELGLDYLLCLCAARLCGLVLRRRRYLLAALFGAAYSVAACLPGLGFMNQPLMKLVSGLALCLIAFGAETTFFRCTGVFFAVSAAFGGILWALSLSGLRPAFDMRALFLSFVLIYAAMRIVLGRRGRNAEKAYAEACIVLGGRQARFMLLIDSGNCLTEPLSGKKVLVASPDAVLTLFEDNAGLLTLEATEFAQAAARIPVLSGRVRLVPFSTLGGSGLLAAFVPDSAYIDGEARELVVALSKSACGDGFEGIL